MDRLSFQECLSTIPAISMNLLRILSDRLRLANERIQSLCALDVYGRVAPDPGLWPAVRPARARWGDR